MSETQKKPPVLWIASVMLLIAVGGACYLLFIAFKDGPVAGCGTGSSCASVLKSRWAYLLPGVPVTVPALMVYLMLLEGLLFSRGRGTAWQARMLVALRRFLGIRRELGAGPRIA